jgi:hypothetical protein
VPVRLARTPDTRGGSGHSSRRAADALDPLVITAVLRPHQRESFLRHGQILGKGYANLLTPAAKELVMGPLPPLQGPITLALIPRERGVDLIQRPYINRGRPDDAHRLTAPTEDDLMVANTGQRFAITLKLRQQAGSRAFRPVQNQPSESVRHCLRIAERERPGQTRPRPRRIA